MEQENKMTIEEASVNLSFVKKELEEEFEFAENQYKVALTYVNIFGETSKEQRDNKDNLIGFLDDDIIMKTETGSIKLEDVKEENESVIRRNIEEFHFEIIQCNCCKVWLEKDEHLESHMLHCLENYNRLSHNLSGFRPANTSDEDKVRGINERSLSVEVDAAHSTASTEIIESKRSSGIDCRAHTKDHIRTTHSNTREKEYKCSECSYHTNYKCNLKQHLNTHNDIKPFECDICKKGYNYKSSLKLHIQINHSNTQNDIKPFECDICKQRFTQKSNLQKHIRGQHSNTSEKEYKCSECLYQTSYKHLLKLHLNTHNDIKPFECDICKKKFSQNGGLKLHIKDHHSNTSEKEYECSECFYQTNYKCSLKLHLNTHNDIKPFECDICKTRFTRKDSLKQHIQTRHSNTHNDIKPKSFECDICKKRFNKKTNLKRHIISVHTNTRNDIKPFECDICKKRFTEEGSLKNHIRNYHSRKKAYKCSECPYQTTDKRSFKRHLDTHNDIKPFECNVCKKGFTRKDSLKKHIRDQHSNSSQ